MIELGPAITPLIDRFIAENQLPDSYKDTALSFYVPLAQRIERLIDKQATVPVVGINGGQGTGKSTCSDLLAQLLHKRGYHALVISIDDLYYGKEQRAELAELIHPLLKTRGVPGTHEIERFTDIVRVIRGDDEVTIVPRFDKATDDRERNGDVVAAAEVDVILFEGWCVGAIPQLEEDLAVACNQLEEEFDADGIWRSFVNESLGAGYAEAFKLIDYLVMLKPANFDVIYEWRGQQESKLLERITKNHGDTSAVMTEVELRTFISHYERLTRWMFSEMPARCDEIFHINEDHQVYKNELNFSRRCLVSTDLDATLLNERYEWESARPALKALAREKAVLVLNSSKTLAEMRALADELIAEIGIEKPVLVAENGGVMAAPSSCGYLIEYLGKHRDDIVKEMRDLREVQGFKFIGFSDMEPLDLVERTGLSEQAAIYALDRKATEPILWKDSDRNWVLFKKLLHERGIKTQRGGQFIHLMGQTDKRCGTQAALRYFQKKITDPRWCVIALGDSPNDQNMLDKADIAVPIYNPSQGARIKTKAMRVILPEGLGPVGWNEAIEPLFNQDNEE